MQRELDKYRGKRLKLDDEDSQSSVGNISSVSQDTSIGGHSSTQDFGLTRMFNADLSVSLDDNTQDVSGGTVDYFQDDFHLTADLLEQSSSAKSTKADKKEEK